MNFFGKLAESVVVGVAGHFIAKPVIEGIEQNRKEFIHCVTKKLYESAASDAEYNLQNITEYKDTYNPDTDDIIVI